MNAERMQLYDWYCETCGSFRTIPAKPSERDYRAERSHFYVAMRARGSVHCTRPQLVMKEHIRGSSGRYART